MPRFYRPMKPSSNKAAAPAKENKEETPGKDKNVTATTGTPENKEKKEGGGK